MEAGIVAIGNLLLESGIVLENVQLAYKRIDKPGKPTVLVCHGLTDSHDVVGTDDHPGWWSGLVGCGKSIDTNKFAVLSFNALGGCDGSTGPLSINPRTGAPYGRLFPEITIRDMVHAERKALTVLGVDRLRAIVGGAFGGMRVLEWGALYADDMDILFPIAVTPKASASSIALYAFETDRQSVNGFDSDSYYTLLRAMQTHDIGRGRGGVESVARCLASKVVALAFTKDPTNLPEEIRIFAHLIPNSTYCLVNTIHGQNGFLTEFEKWGLIIEQSMEVAICRQSKSLYSVSAL